MCKPPKHINMFCVVSIVVGLSGCAVTPTTQISAFGDASSAITDKVEDVLKEYNESALQRQYVDYAARYSGPKADKLTIEELEKINLPITPNVKKEFAIYKANAALGAYSRALSELAKASSQTDIDLAASKLYGSLSGVSAQYKTLSGSDKDLVDSKDLAGFSSAISTIGSAIVEQKRREALKEIILKADPIITTICDVIVSQLKTAGLEVGIATSRQYILAEELIAYKAQAAGALEFEKRRSEIKRLHELQQEISASKLLVQQTQKAIEAVKQSHGVLAGELQKDQFTSGSIAAAIARLKEIEAHYDSFEELLLSCDNVVKDDKGQLSCNS